MPASARCSAGRPTRFTFATAVVVNARPGVACKRSLPPLPLPTPVPTDTQNWNHSNPRIIPLTQTEPFQNPLVPTGTIPA